MATSTNKIYEKKDYCSGKGFQTYFQEEVEDYNNLKLFQSSFLLFNLLDP